jgi:hypothetical protein
MAQKIIQKRVPELTAQEVAQVEVLILRYYSTANDSFIAKRLLEDQGYDIVLLKEGEEVLAVSFYHLTKKRGGWLGRTTYVLQFGQTLKKEGLKGNTIWKLGCWYAKRNIGYLYLLKQVVGISTVISPKVFENFLKLFPRHHFKQENLEDKSAFDFVQHFFKKYRNTNLNIGTDFCFDSHDLSLEEITNDWDKVYKSKQEWINQLFEEKGIIKKQDGRVYKMPRHVVICGIRQPMSFLLKNVWSCLKDRTSVELQPKLLPKRIRNYSLLFMFLILRIAGTV